LNGDFLGDGILLTMLNRLRLGMKGDVEFSNLHLRMLPTCLFEIAHISTLDASHNEMVTPLFFLLLLSNLKLSTYGCLLLSQCTGMPGLDRGERPTRHGPALKEQPGRERANCRECHRGPCSAPAWPPCLASWKALVSMVTSRFAPQAVWARAAGSLRQAPAANTRRPT